MIRKHTNYNKEKSQNQQLAGPQTRNFYNTLLSSQKGPTASQNTSQLHSHSGKLQGETHRCQLWKGV